MLFTTKIVDELFDQYHTGGPLTIPTPWYRGDPNFKRGDLEYQWTDEETIEYQKCAKDIVYFANTYCKAWTINGYEQLTLRHYQEEMLRNYTHDRFNVVMASRQIGLDTINAIYAAWLSIFGLDQSVALFANKKDLSMRLLQRVKEIIIGLPFYMKPGMKNNSQELLRFDNGSRIVVRAATKNMTVGFGPELVLISNAAYIRPSVEEDFYRNLYASMGAMDNRKMVITSNPNGFNRFYQIYDDATQDKNNFKPTRIDWWQVPGRDEAWKQAEINNIGEEAFNKQYGLSFVTTTKND